MSHIKLYTCLFLLIFLLGKVYAIDNLDKILIGGIYKMELLSGDVLEGVVESKTDTSLTIDCRGQPYFFNGSLISRYTLLSPPKVKTKVNEQLADNKYMDNGQGVTASEENGRVIKFIDFGTTRCMESATDMVFPNTRQGYVDKEKKEYGMSVRFAGSANPKSSAEVACKVTSSLESIPQTSSTFSFRLKGDGSKGSFIIKLADNYSSPTINYQTKIQLQGKDWQEVKVPLNSFVCTSGKGENLAKEAINKIKYVIFEYTPPGEGYTFLITSIYLE